jgi:hypothetical protein
MPFDTTSKRSNRELKCLRNGALSVRRLSLHSFSWRTTFLIPKHSYPPLSVSEVGIVGQQPGSESAAAGQQGHMPGFWYPRV